MNVQHIPVVVYSNMLKRISLLYTWYYYIENDLRSRGDSYRKWTNKWELPELENSDFGWRSGTYTARTRPSWRTENALIGRTYSYENPSDFEWSACRQWRLNNFCMATVLNSHWWVVTACSCHCLSSVAPQGTLSHRYVLVVVLVQYWYRTLYSQID